MTDDTSAARTQTIHTAAPTRRASTERVLWWIAFGVLTASAVLMLGLWD